MDEARLREVLSDEGFVRELLAMESEGQVQLALEGRGVELSPGRDPQGRRVPAQGRKR